MKKLLLLTILLLSVIWCFAQQTAFVPDCKDNLSVFQTYPCKIPVIKAGKTVGYTEKNFSFYTAAALSSTMLDKYPILSFSNSIKPPHYKWLMIQPKYGKAWYVDNPDSSGGKYIIHMNRKNFKWLNDSTAVYSPDSLNKKK